MFSIFRFGLYEDYGNYTCGGYPGVLQVIDCSDLWMPSEWSNLIVFCKARPRLNRWATTTTTDSLLRKCSFFVTHTFRHSRGDPTDLLDV